MQPGGHRFDPGQLHQKTRRSLVVGRQLLPCGGSEWITLLDRILGLGGLLVPIVAIIVGGVISITVLVHKHQERIAKIERGIDPDAQAAAKLGGGGQPDVGRQ